MTLFKLHPTPRSLTVLTPLLVTALLHADPSPAGRQVLAGHVPQAVRTARRTGPLSRNTRLNLAVGLPLRNQDELDALLQQIADPASPNYRAWLTPDQFAKRFGPTESDYHKLIAWAEANGLQVQTTHPNRTILDVTGTVAAIETALQINMVAWTDDARGTFYAPDREPSLEAGVQVLDITGLDNYVIPRPMALKTAKPEARSDAATGSGPAGLLIGNDFRAAYAPGVNLSGTGQTIGLFELDGFYASDVAANFKAAGLPAVPVQTVLIDGFSGAPGTGSTEVTLDIMMAAYMAPGVSKIMVYEGTNWNDVFNRMATDNIAKQLSSSWGFSPVNATTEQIFRQMIAQGQSLFQASGDSGAYSGGVMPPSDDPNLTVVGGTHLSTTGPGGQWLAETVWPGSGGGVSTTYTIPSYQQAVNMTALGGSSTMRNIPDLALIADVQMYLIQNNGQAVAVGGTSAAAPLWAGFLALVNEEATQKAQQPLGFVNPVLYAIGAASGSTADFHDIVIGNDGKFSAAPGFDLTTGWGTPQGKTLIDRLTGVQEAASFSLSTSQTSISLTPGTSATATITMTPEFGFTGAVTLSFAGLPSGVTGGFSLMGLAGTSTLTLTAAPTASAGTATVTVTGKSGSITSSCTISLSITPTSSYTVSASPASLSLAQGSTANSAITVTKLNGFSGVVALTASGLPSGVTASFNSTGLTLTASASATPGTSVVTVTATSGVLTKTATIALTVTAAGSFTLAFSPAALTIAQGGTVSGTISIAGQNGFTAPVTVKVSGLPTGVTASFSETTLILTAGSQAAAGTSTITITGTSGSLAKTATVALTVTAPVSYKLSASPASLTVVEGASTTSTITVNQLSGSAGAVAFAVSGLPSGVTGSFAGNVLTLKASTSAPAGVSTITVTGTSGSLGKTTTIALAVLPPPDFSLSLAAPNLNILQGTTGAAVIQIGDLGGFSGAVAFAVSGLPTGVTATFSGSIVTYSAASAAAKGTSQVTITGTSGSLSHRATMNLTVLAPAAGTTPVNLTSAFNVSGIAIDGIPFTGGGLDNGGTSYSGTLLGASQTSGGITYAIAPENAASAVTSKTVALPPGQYSTLRMLATAVNGSQPSQTFIVTYSDGSKSTFTRSLSDWNTPRSYAGETSAATFLYRDDSAAKEEQGPFALYEYGLTLTSAKTVSSIQLPNNRNVVVLAMTLSK